MRFIYSILVMVSLLALASCNSFDVDQARTTGLLWSQTMGPTDENEFFATVMNTEVVGLITSPAPWPTLTSVRPDKKPDEIWFVFMAADDQHIPSVGMRVRCQTFDTLPWASSGLAHGKLGTNSVCLSIKK